MDHTDTEQGTRYNRLRDSKSPYLFQHARNPVDWFSWEDDAFQKAAKEDKPIFLSIGYATCHWCHVMAHESFEDEEVAKTLNEHFVSVKVDREERPDIDHVYMTVCQTMGGQGGWPLSIFMTPEKKPFFAGTYFPKTGRMGMPGFIDLLKQIALLWRQDRPRILDSSEKITEAIQTSRDGHPGRAELGVDILKMCLEQFQRTFDRQHGGFGSAPKFPTPHNLMFLLRAFKRGSNADALWMVEKTLESMRRGGIFDHLGFGFHRYSVDEKWLVPHFEKMLYDQALLAMAYTETFQVTRKEAYKNVAQEIFRYVLRDMTSPEGGFYSAEDADSEGEEGRFYVWTREEVLTALGKEAGHLFCQYYNISDTGNFEDGRSIPHVMIPPELFASQEGMPLTELVSALEQAREKLFTLRLKRPAPLKDDKIITSWNGLMIAALAKGFQAFGGQECSEAAQNGARFVLAQLRDKKGRLLRRYREGEAAYCGFLEDYAFFVWGLLELYEATFEVSLLEEAIHLTQTMVELFWDKKSGGFLNSGEGNEVLIAQSKDAYDGAAPSGNSVAALNLLRLGRLTGNHRFEEQAEETIQCFSGQLRAYPLGYTHLLNAVDFMVGPIRDIVVAGDPSHLDTRAMIQYLQNAFLPHKSLLLRPDNETGQRLEKLCSFVTPLRPLNDKPTVYLCEHFSCKHPITSCEELKQALSSI